MQKGLHGAVLSVCQKNSPLDCFLIHFAKHLMYLVSMLTFLYRKRVRVGIIDEVSEWNKRQRGKGAASRCKKGLREAVLFYKYESE